jgi:hypothetical protein
MTTALSLDIKTTKKLFTRFSSNRATMLRGRHGIGKSQVVYQIASELRHDAYKDHDNCERVSAALAKDSGFVKMMASFWKRNASNPAYAGLDHNVWHYDMGVPVVERRLSQMTEGDITGIPFEGNRGGTVFRACEWLLTTCEFPSVLFLDELNRAIKGVEQATFQLADSKAFDGNLLHEGTRVMVAVNVGDQYDVTPMDPAALSRYAVIDLDPTVQDWLDWANNNCNEAMVEFIRSNERLLEYKGISEPNHKTPDRRAWGNLDAELAQSGLYIDCNDPVFYHMAASMVGTEAASKFWNFMKERALDISAEDVLRNWENCSKRLPSDEVKRNSKFVDIMGKINHKLKDHTMTVEERGEYVKFYKDAPAEVRFTAWKALGQNLQNLVPIHPLLKEYLVESTSKGTTPVATPAPTKAKAAPMVTPKPRTRK